MIFYDTTKAAAARHRSGLMRFSERLGEEIRRAAGERRCAGVCWDSRAGLFRTQSGAAIEPSADDWIITPELFSEAERPGFADFLRRRPARMAAVFYDAIPLRHPHITWPQSVARHPQYVKMLSEFDRVWAISETSRADLEGLWRWMEVRPRGVLSSVVLGADFNGRARTSSVKPLPRQRLVLCLGIVEPRKNQVFLVDVCAELAREGVPLSLEFAGRINPQFGEPIVRGIRAAARLGVPVRYRGAVPDAELEALFAATRVTAVPTLAEGCGLPVLESLWCGIPCVCSDLPVLREHAGGGIVFAPPGDHRAWKEALRRLCLDDAWAEQLRCEAVGRTLPTWAETGQAILADLDRA